jgi:flagellar basal-body rod modification protein FlgD
MANDTTINGTTQSGYSAAPSSVARDLNKELDRNAFLQLLITQLQSQDPLKPMEDREFVAELAQFSSLEQSQQMNTTLAQLQSGLLLSSATSYIGHTVTAQGPDAEQATVGKVTAIKVIDGSPQLIVNNISLDPGWVSRVE